MPQFNSRWSRRPEKAKDLAGELYPDIFTETPPPITQLPNGVLTEDFPVLTTQKTSTQNAGQTDQLSSLLHTRSVPTDQLPFTGGQQVVRTDQLTPVTGALNIQQTQSLVAALQATMTAPQQKLRQPVVIPGKKKRLAEARRSAHAGRRLHPHMRMGLIGSALLAIMLFSLAVLSPLTQADTGVPLPGSLSSWVHVQQQNWSTFTAQITGGDQQAKVAQSTQSQVQVAGPPNIALPTSQYVAIAMQDASDAGIPPTAFVRQIMAESGFDPNAASPAGAVGIAQFEPATAAGLGFNPYDPIAALKGAAQYMASFNAHYNGDYAKALAAYNAGGGTVDAAVQQGGANWMNFIPAETQNYIYKILGV